jgi:predicted branched-subunit amino acid permease
MNLPSPDDSFPDKPWAALQSGFIAGTPLLLGLIPFALIYGAAARNAGLTFFQTFSMIICIYAGSAQLVFVELWKEGVYLIPLVLTGLILNLRLLIYGASLAPHLGRFPSFGQGLFFSYFLTDESYAVSMSKFSGANFNYNKFKPVFYLGTALPTWLCWQSVGLIGYLAGAILPKNIPLAMAVPLVFLSLLISILKSQTKNNGSKIFAALVAGLTAVLLKPLPMNLGLILAIFLGVVAGILYKHLSKR